MYEWETYLFGVMHAWVSVHVGFRGDARGDLVAMETGQRSSPRWQGRLKTEKGGGRLKAFRQCVERGGVSWKDSRKAETRKGLYHLFRFSVHWRICFCFLALVVERDHSRNPSRTLVYKSSCVMRLTLYTWVLVLVALPAYLSHPGQLGLCVKKQTPPVAQ